MRASLSARLFLRGSSLIDLVVEAKRARNLGQCLPLHYNFVRLGCRARGFFLGGALNALMIGFCCAGRFGRQLEAGKLSRTWTDVVWGCSLDGGEGR